MRQLDSGNADGRIVERLEAGHRGTAPYSQGAGTAPKMLKNSDFKRAMKESKLRPLD
jgi:hypothetical protein